MMTPGKYDIKLYRGDTYRWRFTLWQDEAKTQPVDLTGATAKAEIRPAPAKTPITPIACTITDAPNGVIDAVLASGSYAQIGTKGSWDLQITHANGDVNTVLAGAVTVTPDVTDSST